MGLSEGRGDELALSATFGALLMVPTLYVFIRFGLPALAVALAANQMLQIAPMALDLTRPFAAASSLCILVVVAAALYASSISGAGDGLFRLMPTA